MKAAIRQMAESDWKAYRTREGLATDREIAETVHCLNGSQRFRLIVVRWKNAQPSLFEAQNYCYHAVASSREEAESASEVLWGHNQRGEAENWHKELKLELFSGHPMIEHFRFLKEHLPQPAMRFRECGRR